MIQLHADGIINCKKDYKIPVPAAAVPGMVLRGWKRMQKQKVTACIVTYGGFEEAAAAAKSLLRCTKEVDLTLYLVDNASPDGTGEKLRETFGETPRVKVLCLEKNLGFGGGHNAVLDQLDSVYHVVVNPDILLDSDAISALCGYLDTHPEVAMVTPRLLFPDRREQHVPRRKPNVMALLSRQLPFRFLKKYEDHYLMLDEDLSQEQEIDFCTGCFFVIRTQVLRQVGGFDRRYFMYVEDADLTRKVLAQGKAVYWPGATVIHAWHRNPKKKLSSFLQQLWSMSIYFRKWGLRWGLSTKEKDCQ